MNLRCCVVLALLAATAGAQSFPVRATHPGAAAIDLAGYAVSRLGDVDGDTIPDYIVGIHGTTSPIGPLTGRVLVVSGATRQTIYALNGSGAIDRFGFAIDGGKDVDGDGIPDFIVGAPSTFSASGIGQGSVYVFSGSNGANIFTINAPTFDALGYDVALIGDVNFDGRSEFAAAEGSFWNGSIAAPNRVYLYDGASGAVLRTFTAPTTGTTFGIAIAGVGDLDGDLANDIGIGFPTWQNAVGATTGRVEIYSGALGTSIINLNPPGGLATSLFGLSLASIGDVNGDGRPELSIGGPGAFAPSFLTTVGTGLGFAAVYDGATGAILYQANATLLFVPVIVTGLGYATAGGEDIDGDAVPDFVVGAPGISDGTPFQAGTAGSLLTFSGATGTEIRRINRSQSGQNFGQSVALIGDLDNDGFGEILAGSPGLDVGTALDVGSAYVYSLVGAANYGTAFNGMSLQFIAGAPGTATLGTILSAGASPFAPGFIAANVAAANTTFGVPAFPVYLAIDGQMLVANIAYNGSGVWAQALDLRQPAISGRVLYAQTFSATNGIAVASNGLELLFL